MINMQTFRQSIAGLLLLIFGHHSILLADQNPREELEKNRNDFRQNYARLEQLGQKVDALKDQISNLQTELENVELKKKQLKESEDQLDKTLRQQAQEQKDLTETIERQRVWVNDLLRQGWRQTPTVSWRSFLSPRHPDQIARQVSWLRHIVQQRRREIEKFTELRQRQSELIEQARQNQEQKVTKQIQLGERERQLTTLKQNKKRKQHEQKNIIARLRIEQSRIRRDITALVGLIESLEESKPIGLDVVPLFVNGQLSWPVKGKVSHPYGAMTRGVDIEVSWGGVVIASESGTWVRAVYPGQVISVKSVKGYGWVVIVDHGNSYRSMYGYNVRALVQTGDFVEAGEVVSRLKKPSNRQAPWLYFSILKANDPTDPIQLLVPL